MHTLIRDREISKHDFAFYSDRLIRLVGNNLELYTGFIAPTNKLILVSLTSQVVEHGLGYLPFTEKQVITPTGLSKERGSIILSFEFEYASKCFSYLF